MWGAQGWKGSRENCPEIIHPIRAEEKQVWLFSCTDIPKNNLGTVCHCTRAKFPLLSPSSLCEEAAPAPGSPSATV